MIIVEFCGTPGCGKSTFCNLLYGDLVGRGYIVKNLQQNEVANTVPKKVKRKITRVCYQHAWYNKLLKKKLSLIDRNTPSSVYWKNRILETIYRIRRAEREGVQIALFDEGMLQFITSIYHEWEFDGKEKEVIEYLKKYVYRTRTVFIDCTLDVDENYTRLKQRNRVGDRFLVYGDEENKRALLNKRAKIDEALSYIPKQKVLLIDMEEPTIHQNEIIKVIEEMVEYEC